MASYDLTQSRAAIPELLQQPAALDKLVETVLNQVLMCAAERKRWRDHLAALDRESTPRAVAGILDRAGVEHEIGAIRVPTLVLVGAEDVATVPAKSERIAARIAGSTLVVVPRAGHSAPIEEPAAVTAALEAFLARVPR